MTRATGTFVMGYGTAAAYKGWFQPISTALNSVLTRAPGVTGMVDWTTVNAEYGSPGPFEVFMLDDASHATLPLFIRFEYAGGRYGPYGSRFTVGTSVDAAGNIGGALVGPIRTVFQDADNQTYTYWISSDKSYLTYVWGRNPVGGTTQDSAGAIVIERTRNADGTSNADGCITTYWYQDTNGGMLYGGTLPRSPSANPGPLAATDRSYAPLIPNAANVASHLYNDVAYSFPAPTYTPVKLHSSSAALMAGYKVDHPRYSEITASHYGATRKWLSTGSAMSWPVAYMTGTAATNWRWDICPIFRWE